MQRVIHRSIVITLEIAPTGVTKSRAERATAAIASEWLHFIGQKINNDPSMPALQIYIRQLPFNQGAQIQVLLCWITLQAHCQEINDFERY